MPSTRELDAFFGFPFKSLAVPANRLKNTREESGYPAILTFLPEVSLRHDLYLTDFSDVIYWTEVLPICSLFVP